MFYPSWPEIKTTCMTTLAGIECTASTKYGIVSLSATVTESDERLAVSRATNQLKRKVKQQRAYERESQ